MNMFKSKTTPGGPDETPGNTPGETPGGPDETTTGGETAKGGESKAP